VASSGGHSRGMERGPNNLRVTGDMKMNMEEKLLTTAELAAALRVSKGTIMKWRVRGKFPYMRLGPCTARYKLSEVLSALQNNECEAVLRERIERQ